MSSPQKDEWGFSTQPLHVSARENWKDSEDQPPPEPKCPSLSDLLSSCSDCCVRFLYYCCPYSKREPDKFAGVGYLPPEKAIDAVDGPYVENERSPTYKQVFQFPQDPRQFPMHPQIPFKPSRLQLRQPQLKHTPGGGSGKIDVPESPFPTAPYLKNYGPGLQTPLTYYPVQRNLGGTGAFGVGGRSERRRSSRLEPLREDAHSSLLTTTATMGGGGEAEAEENGAESQRMTQHKRQGRHGSLTLERFTKHRPRIFSLRSQAEDTEAIQEARESWKMRKSRRFKRAKTVGSSPSRAPNLDPVKLRRCQTPEFLSDEQHREKAASQKVIAMRRCKTPDLLEHRREEGETREKKESPERLSPLVEYSSPSKSASDTSSETREKEEFPVLQGGKEKHYSAIISTDGKGKREAQERSPPLSTGRKITPVSTAVVPAAHKISLTQAEGIGEKGGGGGKGGGGRGGRGGGRGGAEGGRGSKGVGRGEGEEEGGREPPTLLFSLYFDIQRRTLTVNLMQAENLPHKDPAHGSCDPFVMMFLLPNKEEVLQSVIRQRTLNPKFHQTFEFSGLLTNELKNQVLVFRIFDHDKFSKSDLIGTVILPLKDADLFGMPMRREVDQRKGLLKQFSAGDLLFSLKYSPDRRSLQGIILKATNLRKADIWGLADPYVKVYLIYKNKRVHKWKTPVKKNTLVPIYNESFQFDISEMDIREVSLEIWVMDYDWFSRNDKMGVVYVGINSPQEVGRSHWLEVVNSPEHMASHWHTIIPHSHLKQVQPSARGRQQGLLEVSEEQQKLLLGLKEKEEPKEMVPFSRARTSTM